MNIWLGKRRRGARRLGLEIVATRVTLLGFGCLSGKDDQLVLVGFQPLDVESLALLAQVSPPVVNNDTDTTRLFAVDTRLLKLGESESATFTELAVVANSLAADGGAEKCEGADAELSGLDFAGCASAKLACGLIEPGAHAALPILVEVVIVKNVVVCETHLLS